MKKKTEKKETWKQEKSLKKNMKKIPAKERNIWLRLTWFKIKHKKLSNENEENKEKTKEKKKYRIRKGKRKGKNGGKPS